MTLPLLGRRCGGAAPSGVRLVRDLRRPVGVALAPAGRAPPAGGGVGRLDRVRRQNLPAHPAGKPFAPCRGRGWQHRRRYRPSLWLLLYPAGLTREGQWALGVGTLMLNGAVYGLLLARRHRARPGRNAAPGRAGCLALAREPEDAAAGDGVPGYTDDDSGPRDRRKAWSVLDGGRSGRVDHAVHCVNDGRQPMGDIQRGGLAG